MPKSDVFKVRVLLAARISFRRIKLHGPPPHFGSFSRLRYNRKSLGYYPRNESTLQAIPKPKRSKHGWEETTNALIGALPRKMQLCIEDKGVTVFIFMGKFWLPNLFSYCISLYFCSLRKRL